MNEERETNCRISNKNGSTFEIHSVNVICIKIRDLEWLSLLSAA